MSSTCYLAYGYCLLPFPNENEVTDFIENPGAFEDHFAEWFNQIEITVLSSCECEPSFLGIVIKQSEDSLEWDTIDNLVEEIRKAKNKFEEIIKQRFDSFTKEFQEFLTEKKPKISMWYFDGDWC